MEFFDDSTSSVPDTDVFLDDRSTPGAFSFASRLIQDVTKKGDYPIKYRAYYENYTGNVITSDPAFTVTVIDPCDEPVSVTSKTLDN